MDRLIACSNSWAIHTNTKLLGRDMDRDLIFDESTVPTYVLYVELRKCKGSIFCCIVMDGWTAD